MLDFAKIPVNIDSTNKAELKALCVFFALKQVKYSGCLTNFKRNIPAYAQMMGICSNNLRAKIAELKRMGCVYYTGKHLQLVAYKKLFLDEYDNFYYYTYSGTDVKDIELFIIANAIKKNFKAQEHIIKIKKVEYELSQLKTSYEYNLPYEYDGVNAGNRLLKNSKNRNASQLKKMTKFVFKYHADKIHKAWCNAQINIWSHSYNNFAIVNPFVTLSCRGVSRVCLGKSAPSTGHYLKQRLTKAGYITEVRQSLCNVNRKAIETSMFNHKMEHNDIFNKAKSGVYGLRRTWRTIENKITVTI